VISDKTINTKNNGKTGNDKQPLKAYIIKGTDSRDKILDYHNNTHYKANSKG
jgi:hypothetical protein